MEAENISNKNENNSTNIRKPNKPINAMIIPQIHPMEISIDMLDTNIETSLQKEIQNVNTDTIGKTYLSGLSMQETNEEPQIKPAPKAYVNNSENIFVPQMIHSISDDSVEKPQVKKEDKQRHPIQKPKPMRNNPLDDWTCRDRFCMACCEVCVFLGVEICCIKCATCCCEACLK